jgi:hypothetical protein
MDCERAVQNDSSRHTVPDEIMNSRTPLHCFERDIAERVHAQVQREIGEHNETSGEAKAPDRHLIAENARIYHLTPPPGSARSIVPLGIRVPEGRRKPVSTSAWGNRDQVIELGLRGHFRFDPDSDRNRTALQYGAKGHFRTHAVQHTAASFNHLVGATEQ